jgi:hypothetical protein
MQFILRSKMDHSSHVHDHNMDASTTDNPSTHPNHDMGHMGHPMSFHIGSHEVILFDFWNTESGWGEYLVFIQGVPKKSGIFVIFS